MHFDSEESDPDSFMLAQTRYPEFIQINTYNQICDLESFDRLSSLHRIRLTKASANALISLAFSVAGALGVAHCGPTQRKRGLPICPRSNQRAKRQRDNSYRTLGHYRFMLLF